MKVKFTGIWVKGFGWEDTILQQEDFIEFEELGFNDKDGQIFIGYQMEGLNKQILKGYYIK